MSDRHPGLDCCYSCQEEKDNVLYNIEDDDGKQLCCCRAINADGSVKPRSH